MNAQRIGLESRQDVSHFLLLVPGQLQFHHLVEAALARPRVDDLIASLDQFISASKQLRNAVVYIDDQGSADFVNNFSKGKSALASAVAYLSGVSELIAANQ